MPNSKAPTSFVKQAAILAGASLFVRIMGFAYRIPFTNLIGDYGINFYGSAYRVFALALNLSSGFFIATVSRLVSERLALREFRNAHELFKNALIFSFVLGTVGSLALFFGADLITRLFNFPEGTAAPIRAIAPAVLIVAILATIRGYFMGMKTSAPTAISQVIEQIFNIGFSLWLAFLFFDPNALQYSAAGATLGTAISAAAALIVMLFIYLYVAKGLKARAKKDTTEYAETRGEQFGAIIKTALPIVTGLTLLSIAGIMDLSMANSRLFYTAYFSAEEINVLVGQFEGKFILLTTLPISLSMALSAAVLPEITHSQTTLDVKAVASKTNSAIRISMMLSIPAAVGLAVLADPILALLFPAHPEGGWLLRYGAVSIVFAAIVHIITAVMQGIGHVKLPLIGLFFGVLVKVPLNHYLIAIPSINILGAVISTVVCFFVAALINIFLLRLYVGVKPKIGGAIIKPLVASVGMGVICAIIYNITALAASNAVAAVAALAVGVVAYLAFMVLLKGFTRNDLSVMHIPAKLQKWLYFN